VLVSVEAEAFHTILDRQEAPLVVTAEGGFLTTNYRYLTCYKGLAFHLKTSKPIRLPGTAEVIRAGKIWIPG
jgi:hypothetical protein